MNCINHIDRPAVAACSSCGVFLCRECASKYKPILCDDCFNEINRANRAAKRQKEANEGRKLLVTTPMLIAVVDIIAAIGVIIQWIMGGVEFGLIPSLLSVIVGATALVCLPYGWRAFDYLTEKLFGIIFGNNTLIFVNWLYWIIKLIIADIIGIPCYIYAVMRYLKGRS